MSLPLPQVVADVGPGGGLVTSLRGMNALTNSNLENQYAAIKNKYAPLSMQAQAASQLAYANLMGPQFLAKLMGNDAILANTPDPQKKQALQMLFGAATGQGPKNSLQQLPTTPSAMQTPSNGQLSGWLTDKIKSIIEGNKSKPQVNPVYEGNNNALLQHPNLSPVDRKNIQDMNMQPGGSYTFQVGDQSATMPSPQGNPATFSENVGNYEGTIAEGKEQGKIRANDIKELNDTAFNAQTKLATLNDLNDIISSPIIREIRQTPLLGSHEIAWFSKEGTPEQQQMIGRLKSQIGNVVKDSSKDFNGQFRVGEQQLLNSMKVNDSDTIDVMIGKQESLTTMTKLLYERSKLTADLMDKYHINKGKAMAIADKQINGDQIRKEIHDKLNPMVTITNRKTGERKTVSIEEARALGVPNV